MLPQLASETFPSQIFWVVLGFFCVYGFMSFFAAPRLKKILDQRRSHVDNLLDIARRFSEKSEKIEQEANDLLAKTKQDIYADEAKLIEELEKKSSEEKQKISEEILRRTKSEIALLNASSEEVFKEVSADLDQFLDLALQKMEDQKS
ncbi:MAG: hypothetical protein J5821_01695 [Alphaproteobacteria bacterium]|nr:hypothetical protein [Alphaproteobacteria bacterium]